MHRRLRLGLAALGLAAAAAPAAAETNFACHVRQVMQTRFGTLVSCAEHFLDSGAFGKEDVSFFAAEATATPNAAKIAPALTPGQMMLAFQAVALEAFRSGRPLIVTFTPGARPGGLFDCLNANCRLARAWSVSQ